MRLKVQLACLDVFLSGQVRSGRVGLSGECVVLLKKRGLCFYWNFLRKSFFNGKLRKYKRKLLLLGTTI